MSMSDNFSGHGSKSKKVARRNISLFLLLLNAKNRLSISEMVSAQSLQKVWVLLKKKATLIYCFSVLNGMKTVKTVESTQTSSRGDRPVEDVKITASSCEELETPFKETKDAVQV